MLASVLLGVVQGVFEWLPVSSEGVVAAVYAFVFDRPLAEAVSYALWLHLGTALAALITFRVEVVGVLRDMATRPRRLPPLSWFLVVSTGVSAVVGFPLLATLGEVSRALGAVAMAVVGVLMLVTGAILWRRPATGSRTRDDLSVVDAGLAGVVQGAAALPGLSRSGLTLAALLTRGVERREALAASFLMSIPASLGAGTYAGLSKGLWASTNALVAAAVACVVGLATMRVLLALARRVNFAPFVALVGATIILGAAWQIWG